MRNAYLGTISSTIITQQFPHLIRALLLRQHDLAEAALAQHLDEVEVVQRHRRRAAAAAALCQIYKYRLNNTHN